MVKLFLHKNDILESVKNTCNNSNNNFQHVIQNLIKSKPFGDRKFYIHSFMKHIDDLQGIKKLYHHPRLTKPYPTPGSSLMKVDPENPEEAIVIWTLPDEESFKLYKQGKIFQNQFIHECIGKFLRQPQQLCEADPEDPSDNEIREIYRSMKKGKPNTSHSSSKV